MKTNLNQCPPAALLDQLLLEELSASERDEVETHVESCASCQKELERLVPTNMEAAAPSLAVYDSLPDLDDAFLNRLKTLSPPGPHGTEPIGPGYAATLGRGAGDRFTGRRLGQYEVQEKIGSGNMGAVYKAVHSELGKVVALKVLPAANMDEVSVARFKNEARAVGRLDHPNVVAVHDGGQVDGVHFLVMGLVDGTDLARLVQRHGRLSVADACEVVRQAALGLHHAFERGLVHRDVKPSNLMLARDGVVKVLDLGIARSFGDAPVSERLTATGMLLGTADYLAPEQWENPHAVDSRADVYGLGCTLYHLLAGRPPYGPQYDSILKKMRAHLEAPVPSIAQARPEVPPELVSVMERMLAKNPADRFSSPGDVADALRPFAAGADLGALLAADANRPSRPAVNEPAVAADTAQRSGTQSQVDRSGDMGRRKPMTRWAVGALILANVCVAVVAAIALWFSNQPQKLKVAVKIEKMTVKHYRGKDGAQLGDLATTDAPVGPHDRLRVFAKLSAAAHCYLIAFNPDGTEQLCYPEDATLPAVYYPKDQKAKSMLIRPAKSAEVTYPRDDEFEPGVPGLQVFVLVASSEPLPPYAEWRSKIDAIPWKKTEAVDQARRWQFEHGEFARLRESDKRVDRVQSVPKEFRELCEFFQGRSEFEAVQAIAFPVAKD